MEIKDKLKNRRIELGLTLDEVGRKIGVSGATISRWETGDIANMRRDKIMAYAEALRISPGVIMGWEENVNTIAAHHDDEDWSEEELQEIENFKKYVLSKRK